jgi:hypothetical protein
MTPRKVWLIHGPEATWDGTDPPPPGPVMHQLGALRGSVAFPHLDSHIFAQQVRTLLVPPPPTTPPLAGSPP